MTHKEFIIKWVEKISDNEKRNFIEDFYDFLEVELKAQQEGYLKIIDETLKK